MTALKPPESYTFPMTSLSAEHRTFTDADGVTIHFTVWPARSPQGVVQISHGQGDHSQRYAQLAAFLVGKGFTVYANDHRGHGETWRDQWGGDTSKFGMPGVRGIRGMIDAINDLTAIARSENSGLPLVFLGHSMGSFLGQIQLDEGSLDADLVVWSGTALRTPFTMNAGDLNAKHKHLGNTGHEWLSRDTAVHHAFAADPLTFHAVVIKQFGLSDGLKLFGLPKKPTRDIPILMLHGGEDVVGSEKSVASLAQRYLTVGYSDVELVVYSGARHEVYNETNRDEVVNDLVTWITERLEA
jgi:alpha-beta hydrolase superfamily lysophospholipase